MKATLLSCVLFVGTLFPAREAAGIGGDDQLFYLLTQSNGIVSSVRWMPEAAGVPVPVTGLGGYNLVGIDVRTTVRPVGAANPGVGSLWALGVSGGNARVFVIDLITKAATPVGPVLTGIDGSGSGDNGWFFGHDPGRDRFRIMNSNRNYELDPNTMTVTRQADLVNPLDLNGSAFSPVSYGEASRAYFVSQSAGGDPLVTSANPAAGVFANVGATGLDFTLGAGLDIAGDVAFLAASVGGVARLYQVDLATGLATGIGAIGTNPTIRALATWPTFFPPSLPVTLKVRGKRSFATPSHFATIRGTAACRAGIERVEYRVGTTRFRKARGTVRWVARVPLKRGRNVVVVRATGKNQVRSKPVRLSILSILPRFAK